MQRNSIAWYLMLLDIVLVALAWYLALSNYPNLPDKIPTHFGASGIVDGWGGKGMIFLEPGVQIGIFLLFLGLAFMLPRLPKSMVNLPRGIKEDLQKLSEEDREKIYRGIYSSLPTMLFGLDIPLNLLSLFILVTTIKVAYGEWQSLSVKLMIVFIAVLIGIGVYYFLKMYRKIRHQIKSQYL